MPSITSEGNTVVSLVPVIAARAGRPLESTVGNSVLAAPALLFIFPALIAIEPRCSAPLPVFGAFFALMTVIAAFSIARREQLLYYVAAFFAVVAEATWSVRYLNEETLLSIAISHALLVVMRPDYQDYQGTGLTVEIARELDVPEMMILINKAPATFDVEQIRQTVSRTYNCPVAGVIPHSDEMMSLASHDIFAVRYPDHPIVAELQNVARALIR